MRKARGQAGQDGFGIPRGFCLPGPEGSAGTAGRSGPLAIATGRARRAVRLDLLERESGELPITGGILQLDLPAHGFAAVRLE